MISLMAYCSSVALSRLAGRDQLVELQEQLGHHAVGAADAAVSADSAASHKLLVGTVEHDELALGSHAGGLEHLDVLGWHGGVLHADDLGILQHGAQQIGGQGHAGQLGNVVDDEVGVGSGGRDVVPVLGNAVGGQLKVDGRDGGDGVHTQLSA